ncbi:MAG: DJ-1/PfpI family protein [Clostridiales bacterium]|nr:DJ-1/PfpI family protein [Clostridiales bacterium]
MSVVGVFFAEGYEEIEALTVVDILRRGGIEVRMISVTGEKEVTGSHKITVKMDQTLSETDFLGLDMIVLPGGMPGTTNLESCALLMEQVDAFNRQGKGISAICAAPSIFGHRGMLEGRNACCYPDREPELSGALVTKNPVEVSEHVTTSRGMGTAIEFALAILERFQGREAADRMAEKIVYVRA